MQGQAGAGKGTPSWLHTGRTRGPVGMQRAIAGLENRCGPDGPEQGLTVRAGTGTVTHSCAQLPTIQDPQRARTTVCQLRGQLPGGPGPCVAGVTQVGGGPRPASPHGTCKLPELTLGPADWLELGTGLPREHTP